MIQHQLLCIATIIVIINRCTEHKERAQWAMNPVSGSKEQLEDCPVWFFYNETTEQCECYNMYQGTFKCIKQKAFVRHNFYMTYSKQKGLFFSFILVYYDASGFGNSSSHPGFIELPSNISELNDYMCGPCSE